MPSVKATRDLFEDPEQARITRQLAEAEALRQGGMSGDIGQGYQGGKIFIVGNPLGNIAKAIGGAYMANKAEGEQSALMGQRQQAEQDYLAQMPSETASATLPADQSGPTGTYAKPHQQLAGEMRQWAVKGASAAPHSALARAIAAKGMDYSMTAPQRMAEAEERNTARQDELNARTATQKELQAERLAAQQERAQEAASLRMTLAQMSAGNRNANADLDRQIKEARLDQLKAQGLQGNAAQQKFAIAQKEKQTTLNEALANIDIITAKNGPLEKATASGVGTLYDKSMGFFGKATPGAIAAAKLAPLADPILKMVPRFEGPQSDKDTASYKEAAGQLANSEMPTEVRMSAAKTIKDIMLRRKSQFGVKGMEDVGVPSGAPTGAIDFGSLK